MTSLVELQNAYTATLFQLESTRQSVHELDKAIDRAQSEIHDKPDIREHEHEVAESRSGRQQFFRFVRRCCDVTLCSTRCLCCLCRRRRDREVAMWHKKTDGVKELLGRRRAENRALRQEINDYRLRRLRSVEKLKAVQGQFATINETLDAIAERSQYAEQRKGEADHNLLEVLAMCLALVSWRHVFTV